MSLLIKSLIPDDSSWKIAIVLPDDNFKKWESLVKSYIEDDVDIIRGDKERNLSVRNGINHIQDNSGYVAIHDGVRPFISEGFILKLFNEAFLKGNAIPFTTSSNSMRKIDKKNNYAVDRSSYVQIQTPQVFKVSELKEKAQKYRIKWYFLFKIPIIIQ